MNNKTLLKKIQELGKEKKTETMTFRFSKREKMKLVNTAKALNTTSSTLLRAQIEALRVAKKKGSITSSKGNPNVPKTMFLKMDCAEFHTSKS